ncbi:MAG: hypothetical protein KC425_07210, partial [Anaerolineales bacterium]|nr:hypothetical protein [Anaerolineales bacterium]
MLGFWQRMSADFRESGAFLCAPMRVIHRKILATDTHGCARIKKIRTNPRQSVAKFFLTAALLAT